MRPILAVLLFCQMLFASQSLTITDSTDIARVWAGHPVDFAAIEVQGNLFIAYYDTARSMVIAHRSAGQAAWEHKTLPTVVGWDSHNSISMAVDQAGYLHISGNMHNVPLVYFRSEKPYSIETFSSPGMTGKNESSVTYPVFVRTQDGTLYFQFRDGGSGNGNTLWNRYDLSNKRWERVGLGTLFDGGGAVNAYPTTPKLGPDGNFHVLWMWRETPVANTNFHLSHMMSANLQTWKTVSGNVVQIPITTSTQGVVVDPVESGNGLINMDFGIGWDSEQRPVATYHRYNGNLISQIYNARFESGQWKIYQTSAWTSFKWDLDRVGSLSHDIAAQPIQIENGRLVQRYVYRDGISRIWELNESDLSIKQDSKDTYPDYLKPVYATESTWVGMQVHTLQVGMTIFKWEALPINQDLPYTAYPSGSTLKCYQIGELPAHSNASPIKFVRPLKMDQGSFDLLGRVRYFKSSRFSP